MRVCAVAESDSFVAWAHGILGRVPTSWVIDRTVITYPTNPTTRQMVESMGSGSDNVWKRRATRSLERLLVETRPDVVLLACTGPLVARLTDVVRSSSPHAVIVNGLPGVALPLAPRAVAARAGVDVMLVHSRSEQRALRWRFGRETAIGLVTLPELEHPAPLADDPVRIRRLVFADQAIIPASVADRRRLARLLCALPVDDLVLKQRSRPGEPSTHLGSGPMVELIGECSNGAGPRVSVESGSLDVALRSADGLLTVSSTAALVALARGLPVGCIADFGISERLRNQTFAASSMMVSIATVGGSVMLQPPDQRWMSDNYFHGIETDDWRQVIERAVEHPGRASARPRGTVRTRLKTTALAHRFAPLRRPRAR